MEEHLTNAISAAKIAGISNKELVKVLKMLLEAEE
jgi:hypothetical protein